MSRTLSFVDRFCAMGLIDWAQQLKNRGKYTRALKVLRRAGVLGEDDAEVIGKVAEALRELGKIREAEDLLRRARFRHGRNPLFRQIWNQHRFQTVLSEQGTQTTAREENFILPFVQPSRLIA